MKEEEEEYAHRPLRVLMVTGIYPTVDRPHAGTFIRTLVEALRAERVEVEIIHPPPGPVFWRYLQTIFQVWCKTRQGTCDIVHGHYAQWCLFARLQWRVPVVAAFLGDDLLGTVTARGGYSKQGAIIVALSRWLCQHVDMALVKSEEMRLAARNERVRVIPDGVDFELFRPLDRRQMREELGWRRDGYYILFANNPAIAVKNVQLARSAIACLAELGIEAELVVASGLPQTELVRYMNACNALILPSHAEGSPNVVKEAAACGVPVVATDVGDVREVIGRTEGCSVCVTEPMELARGLWRAIECGWTTGREDVAGLEVGVIARRTIAVYREVLENRRRKG